MLAWQAVSMIIDIDCEAIYHRAEAPKERMTTESACSVTAVETIKREVVGKQSAEGANDDGVGMLGDCSCVTTFIYVI